MDHTKVSFSNLTSEQVQDLKALETKFNSLTQNGQETILIAYENPKNT